jgi:hypothetical protein
MAREENLAMVRRVRHEFARHPIDTNLMVVTANHGVVRIQGTVRRMRGHDIDVEAVVHKIATHLRGKDGIRDVVIECTFRG